MIKVSKLDFEKNPNIGLFGLATDACCFLPNFIKKKKLDLLKETLNVRIVQTSVLGTDFPGIFLAGNLKGILLSDRLYDNERDLLEKHARVLILKTKHTALGNIVLMNDRGIIISKEIMKHRKEIKKFFGLSVEVGSIAGSGLVGSLAAVNNNGCLVNKNIKEKERNLLEKTLRVEVFPGSVNFGNPWIRSGIIANSHGLFFGSLTTGPEMGIITEALGFI